MKMKKQYNLKAAVFDVDGMLLDTREFIFQAYEDTLKQFGHKVPDRKTISKQIGRSLQDCYLAFAPNGDIRALCMAHDTFQNRPEMIKLITPYPVCLKCCKSSETPTLSWRYSAAAS
jgi:beta-phosphoglucomutase-like phosphatase (HAD superfamily)